MTWTDDLDREVKLVGHPPQRIISLVPSLSELLFDLGLEDRIVGITKFCVFPEAMFRSKTRIGGTKTLQLDKIAALRPDLILANKEENQQEDVEKLSAMYPTYVTDIQIYPQAIEKIKIIGELTGSQTTAKVMLGEIKQGFERLKRFTTKPKVAYMIWKSPYMVAGGDTYISDMLERSGFENVFAQLSRYPIVDIEALKEKEIDYIFLSSEPFPFKESHVSAFQKLMPGTKAILADGTMFSWYGSRLRLAPAYFEKLRAELKI